MPARRSNHLLQLVHQRVNRLVARLEPQRWRRQAELPVLAGALREAWIPLAEAQREAMQPLAAGTFLGSGWQQRWCRVEIPAGPAGRHLAWRCQGEATAWRDGVPWAGLDVAHPTCPVGEAAHTLWLEVGTWQTGLWAPGATPLDPRGPRFDSCVLQSLEAPVDAALADLDVLRQLVALQFKDHGLEMPATIGFCSPIDRVDPALRVLLGGLEAACEAYDRDGLAALGAALARLRERLRAAPGRPALAVVAQSHIDLVYLWPERVAEAKTAHTCATQLRLLEADPAFRFSHSQPLSYLALGRHSPGLLAQIRQRIAEGRWELTGAFACEPDTNIPCGEGLFRSLRIGQAITRELTGAPSRVCWLPDVFGYSACLPALLRLAGVGLFFTSKLSWSPISRFPWTSFVWRGHDGGEVLAQLWAGPYNNNAALEVAVTAVRDHREVHLHPEQIAPFGYGDGGGGPNPEMLARVARMADLAGVPRCTFDRAEAVLARMEPIAPELPVHQGELYLEAHRGTLTSQQRMKAAYRGLERALQAWEAVRCARGGGAVDAHPWQRLCFAQFHDALPGSSIALVYQELVPELERLAADALAAAGRELGDGNLPFNVLPFPRLVWDGARLWRLGALGTGEAVAAPAVATALDRLDNGIVVARFADGALAGLSVDGRELQLRGGGFTLAPDNPANYDAWDIDQHAHRLARPVGPVELTVAGPGRLRGSCALGERSRLTVDYLLLPGERHLRVEVAVEWQEEHRLLRYELDTGCAGASARFGCPFGSILRPQQAGGAQSEGMWEVPASRWAAALRDDGSGVALLAASNWGWSCRDGHLGVSLLRAPTYPDAQCDRGSQRLSLAVGEHSDRFAGDALPTAAAAEALWAPLPRAAAPVRPLAIPAVGSLVPAWACPTAAGVEVRLHEVGGSAGVLELPAAPVDALGAVGAKAQQHAYGPYAVLSLLLSG